MAKTVSSAALRRSTERSVRASAALEGRSLPRGYTRSAKTDRFIKNVTTAKGRTTKQSFTKDRFPES